MAPIARKSGAQSTQAEIKLVQLKNCLVNLPATLVSVLVNADTAAQNVVIELAYPSSPSLSTGAKSSDGSGTQKSVFVGWTGMPSKRKLVPVTAARGGVGEREQEAATVEIDATFGRLLGLADTQKVGVLLHLEPPLVHTINIEPLTPADWEIIELHANFLELNLLSQVRALPNPSFKPSHTTQPEPPHPLALHLSPTSTVNVVVTSLTPSPPSTSAFVKVSPDAEVIVAPKSRPRPSQHGRQSSSVGSAGRKSVGGRSGASTARHRDDSSGRGALFLRGVDRGIGGEWFEDDENMSNEGLRVWVDRDILASKQIRGSTWVCVSVVKPAGLQTPKDTSDHVPADEVKPATNVVASISVWDDAPDCQHIALSSTLCAALNCKAIIGDIVRIEAAPPQTRNSIKALKVYPFISTGPKKNGGLKFGGESKAEKEEASQRLKVMFGGIKGKPGFLDGPLTDGLVLEKHNEMSDSGDWAGGIVRFEPPLSGPTDSGKAPWAWFMGSERKFNLDVQAETPRPSSILKAANLIGEPLPSMKPILVGIDTLINQLTSHLLYTSSVLLTGGLGSGKTSLAQLLAHNLRKEHLFHTTYLSCRKLATEETRLSTIKRTLDRAFMAASWGARLGGRSLVILDDLDRLCPVETELQVGQDNGRSRMISECLVLIVRNYCGMESGIVLLATGQGKESINNVIVGSHIVREIISLKAPDKEGRRRILDNLLEVQTDSGGSRKTVRFSMTDGVGTQNNESWMEEPFVEGEPGSTGGPDGFVISRNLDTLDLAGRTDGYMPADLKLLVARGRNEALIRAVEHAPTSAESSAINLGKDDFTKALKGFTPASLRNVTLQSSTTTFASIGGLHSTRKVLLETLQYPTTYGPIFANCPLRLRSGLLLYGYPGCGKTLLASAVAGECGLNFISVKGPEILNKYIGASEKSVRDLFERAEAAKPCVLFFDEFDSIAPKRGHDSTGVTDRVVNQLLTQMDGAEGLSGVYVLAATSRPDLIDPALLRPGRLDKSLICDLPNLEDRVDILRALSAKLVMSEEVLNSSRHGDDDDDDDDDDDEGRERHDERKLGLLEIAKRTEGYSGADLQAVIYNAHLEAVHDLLGDRNDNQEKSNGQKEVAASKKPKTTEESIKQEQEFIQFRFGISEDQDDIATPKTPAQETVERANIISKLEAIKLSKRKERELRRQRNVSTNPNLQHGNGNGNGIGERKDKKEVVVIEWTHIIRSLKSTRSSISPEERMRLRGIYGEFLMGRNGEMPSGQGSMEVGGRSSLM
ncbi:MAG: hypothetical protein M1812_007456 [Candelaria pacifica]|nr:MAG: hypothetical protein M1812_007456 [Candelaria pacifica]